MKKRTFAKRIMTVMLAAAMALSNTAAVYATEPDGTEDSSAVVMATAPGYVAEGTDAAMAVTDKGTDDTSDPNEGSTDDQSEEAKDAASSDEEIASGEDNAKGSTDAGDVADKDGADGKQADGKAVTDKDTEKENEDIEVMEATAPSQTASVDASDLPDSDDLLEGFLEKQLEEQIKDNQAEVATAPGRSVKGRAPLMAAVPRSQGMNLTGNDLAVYNYLKTEIGKIAAGQLDSSAIIIPMTQLNEGKLRYTKDELTNDPLTQAGINEFLGHYNFDLGRVQDALLADCPYELYWFDKTKGTSTSSYSYLRSSEYLEIPADTVMTVYFKVSAAYATGGYTNTTSVDTAKTTAVSTAVTNANNVVTAAVTAGCNTDYKKLVYYRDWIADNVKYNRSANPNGNYGDPWQVIYVFDGNPDTDVVCEGYSKAFKWLCDLSTFADSKTGCHLVSGDLGQDGSNLGAHMWNIVRMDNDKYYLADITNYDNDYGPSYYAPKLFLDGYSSYTNGVYRYNLSNTYLTYTYDSDTISQFSATELAMSDTAYEDSYTVTFDMNGHGTAPSDITSLHRGDKISAPVEPKVAGYSFIGWYRDRNCNTAWSFDTDTITGSMTLYACWAENKHLVTFNANNGTSAAYSQNVLDSVATPLNQNTFTYSGYRFTGWNTAENGSDNSYADKESVTLTDDLTLYAQWTEIDADAPIIVTQPAESMSLTWSSNARYPLTISATAAAETGYTLRYQWYYSTEKKNTGGSPMPDGTTNKFNVWAKPVGTAYYYCVVTAERNDNGKTASVTSAVTTVNIGKAASAIAVAPIAKEDLIYNKTAQELVTEGTASPSSCTVVYSLSPDGPFDTQIPKGTNAGTYSVYYKVQEDSVYNESEVAGPINVTIAKKPVTVSGITASNKTYDKTVNATLNGNAATIDGKIDGDTLAVSATGSFEDASVGTNKDVTISNIALEGASVGNYVLATTGQQETATANITAKSITVSGIRATDKVYDGNTTATLNCTDAIFSGIYGGDSLSASATGTFADKNVGTAKCVTISGITLSGTDASNYTVAGSGNQTTTTAAITPKSVTISGITASDKTYNGDTTAVVSGTGTIEGVRTGDTVSISAGTAAFSDANAGTGKTVTFSGFSLTGEDATNYELASQPASVTATINKKSITPTVMVVGGPFTYTGEKQEPAVLVKDGETVLTSTDYYAGYPDGYNLNAGADKGKVVVKETTNGNYTFSDAEVTYNIAQAPLTVRANDFTFKRGNTFNENDLTATIEGLKGNDGNGVVNYTLSIEAGDDQMVGDHTITVNVSTVSDNYNVTSVNGTLHVVDKYVSSLAVTQTGITYLGTTLADPTYTAPTLGAGETYQSTEVEYSGTLARGGNYSLTTDKPTEAGEYTVSVKYVTNTTIYSGSANFTIAKRNISDAIITLGDANTYNGAEQIQSVTSVKIGDATIASSDYTVSGNSEVGAGSHTLTVTAKDASNYTGSATATYSIGKKQVTIASGITASNKEYDGTTTATLDCSGASITGLEGGDTLTVTATGAFADANVGTGKTVTITSHAISGDKAVNYELATTGNQETTTADITKKSVSPTVAVTGTYTYNKTAQTPTYTVTLNGANMAASDYEATATNNTNAGTATLTVSAKDTGNYSFADISRQFTIAKKPVTVSGITAADKTYDATDSVTLNYGSASFDGKETGDALTVTASGAFTNVNAGTGRQVRITNIVLGGTDVANYVLASSGQQTQTTATISAKNISPVVSVTGSYTYNGSPITPTYSVWDNELGKSLTTADYTATLSADHTNAGSPTITISAKSGGNYTFTDAVNTFTINRAAVTVKAEDKVKKLGNADPALTASVTGLIGSDTVNYTLSRATGNDLGEYQITASGDAVQGNYNVTFVNGKLTIVEKPVGILTVTKADTTYRLDQASAPVYTKPAGTAMKEVINYTGTLKNGTTYNSNTAPAEAGDYKVTVTYETEEAIYTGDSLFKILPIDLSKAEVTLGSALTYKQSEQTQTITSIKVNGVSVSDICTISGDKAATAGDHVIKIYDNGSCNLTGTKEVTYTIAKKPVTIKGVTAASKVYDGTNVATISGTPVIEGLISGDMVNVDTTAAKALFTDKKAGSGKAVTFTGITLTGTDAANYSLSAQPASVTADITPAEVTVSGIKAKDKVYDENDKAEIDTASAVITGMISGDELAVSAVGKFSDKNVGTGKTVEFTSVTLTGKDAPNYKIRNSGSQLSATADITKAPHKNETLTQVDIKSGGVSDGKLDIGGYLIEDATVLSATKSGDAAALITLVGLNPNKEYTYSATSGSVGTSGNIIFTATSTNYADYTITVPVTIKAKVVEVVLEKNAGVTTSVTHVSTADLSEIADAVEGDTAEVKLKAKPVADSEIPAEVKTSIDQTAKNAALPGVEASHVKTDNLDLTITQSADGGAEKPVSELDKVIEMHLRWNASGKYAPKVVRNHGSLTSALKQLASRPASGSYADGTFFIDRSGSGSQIDVYIYTRLFSVYSIVYSDVPTYQVAFDDAVGNTTFMDMATGSKVYKPAAPSRSGYAFTGWYDNAGNAWNFDNVGTDGMVLTAGWAAIPANDDDSSSGGSGGGSSSDSSSSSAPAAVKKAEATPDPAALALLSALNAQNKKSAGKNKAKNSKTSVSENSDDEVLTSPDEYTVAEALVAPNTGDTLPDERMLLLIMVLGCALVGFGIRQIIAERKKEVR